MLAGERAVAPSRLARLKQDDLTSPQRSPRLRHAVDVALKKDLADEHQVYAETSPRKSLGHFVLCDPLQHVVRATTTKHPVDCRRRSE